MHGLKQIIKIIIQGEPIAKKRPRFARRGKFTAVYSAQETEESKTLLIIMDQMRGRRKLSGPLKVSLDFFLKRPKSHFGTGRNSERLKPSAPAFPAKKPDIDNCVKFIYDVCNGLVWEDDCQIVDETARKRYDASYPRTEIIIEPVTDHGCVAYDVAEAVSSASGIDDQVNGQGNLHGNE